MYTTPMSLDGGFLTTLLHYFIIEELYVYRSRRILTVNYLQLKKGRRKVIGLNLRSKL